MGHIKRNKCNSTRTCALIVAYNPDIHVLRKVLSSLAVNVEKIFVFDNTVSDFSSENYKFCLDVPLQVFSKSENIGIAAAQNLLLKKAQEEGFDFSIMSDQDTIFPAAYASDLIKYCFDRDDVAAVCPGWVDVNLLGEEKYPGQYIFDSRMRLKIDRDESKILEVAHAISSGMVVNMRLLRQVGLMNEDLFIDWVDNEWCWRARASGLVLLAVPSVKVRHTLGDCTVKVFGKNFVKRGVMRNFYIIRNAIYLVINSPIPLSARAYLAKKAIHHTIFSLIVSSNKFVELRWLARAWLHGLQGKLGKVL